MLEKIKNTNPWKLIPYVLVVISTGVAVFANFKTLHAVSLYVSAPKSNGVTWAAPLVLSTFHVVLLGAFVYLDSLNQERAVRGVTWGVVIVTVIESVGSLFDISELRASIAGVTLTAEDNVRMGISIFTHLLTPISVASMFFVAKYMLKAEAKKDLTDQELASANEKVSDMEEHILSLESRLSLATKERDSLSQESHELKSDLDELKTQHDQLKGQLTESQSQLERSQTALMESQIPLMFWGQLSPLYQAIAENLMLGEKQTWKDIWEQHDLSPTTGSRYKINFQKLLVDEAEPIN